MKLHKTTAIAFVTIFVVLVIALSIQEEQIAGAAHKTVATNKDIVVGSDTVAKLSTSHILGKDYRSNNPDTLYLNREGFEVYVGGIDPANLIVHGNVGINTQPKSKLDVNGTFKTTQLTLGGPQGFLCVDSQGFLFGSKQPCV